MDGVKRCPRNVQRRPTTLRESTACSGYFSPCALWPDRIRRWAQDLNRRITKKFSSMAREVKGCKGDLPAAFNRTKELKQFAFCPSKGAKGTSNNEDTGTRTLPLVLLSHRSEARILLFEIHP